jgi:hypothetical protein
MTTVSYLMSVTTSQNDVEVTLAILNIAGMGQAFYGERDSTGGTDLWIIPQSKKSSQEVTTQLQAVPAIHSVSVVPVSKPVKETELTEVRELFVGIGWDASSVTDEELSLFINAKLQGQYTYYIDHDKKKKGKEPVKIRIRPSEEHPHFSPDWLKKNDYTEDDVQNRVLTIDDIEIRTVTIVHQIAVEPPPPPPRPPHNLHQMTDAQIRQWIRKRVSHRLKNEDIEVQRTSEEIFITIKLDEQTETIGYRLTK